MGQNQTAYHRISKYYAGLARKLSSNFNSLDLDQAQILVAINWLSGQNDPDHMMIFLEMVRNLIPYLKSRSLNDLILGIIQPMIRAAGRLEQNPGWIYTLAYESNWALGKWEESLTNISTAVQVTKGIDPENYALALRFLGSLQLNKGDYKIALQTFALARQAYHDAGDFQGEMSITAEEAAYYLNKADYPNALRRYSEIETYETENHHFVGDHTLMMMGVIHRRVRNFEKSIAYFEQLIDRSQDSNTKAALATASHHLAWTYIDLGQFEKAKEYGEQARRLYEEIHDIRGGSDADEQLCLIALGRGDFQSAQMYIQRSLQVRKELGSKQGYASSIHRLSKLYFLKGNYLRGLFYLFLSLFLYYRIGMLPRSRVIKYLRDAINKRITT